jgi:cell division protein FtsB
MSFKIRRGALWPLLATVTLIGLLFIGVFPTRTYLAQRSAMSRAEERLDVLQAQNTALEGRVAALNTDEAIERLAREQYNLVRPGEEAYAILPAPPVPVEVPAAWPFDALAQKLQPAQP